MQVEAAGTGEVTMCVDRNNICSRLIFMMTVFLLMSVVGTAESFAQSAKQPETQAEGEKGEEVERAFMGGTEIQGSIEKPHVVYIVPWKEGGKPSKGEINFDRSFKEEILAPLEYSQFHRQWGQTLQGGK